MALEPGARLGPYEIISMLGEGGMGRVYRARDTKLQRQVAIKVLPDNVAADPERVARFEREARTLAALNHPHIAQIYGTEQSGQTHALVMELVEGEDLSGRIARGPIPWHEAAPIAKQMAAALETAHDNGIIHRDLKPANIKITPDGAVKVLDFGLAKAVESTAEVSPASATVTSPAGVTQAGFILGTAAYMSPEQAKGRPADKRSDVWAFGCVLYEMLTGSRAFPGDDIVDTLSAVMRVDPDFNALPGDVPAPARALIEQCLIKDRRERIADIAAAKFALRLPAAAATPAHRSSGVIGWAVAALAIVVALGLIAPRSASRPPDPQPVIRSTVIAPAFSNIGFASVAMSRQGTHIAYTTQGRGIHVRRLSEAAPSPLQGTDGGTNPFFSYNGEWLGFFADGQLKKIPLSGGAAQVVADAPSGRGGSWAADGTIVFSPAAEAGLVKVSDEGGPVVELTKVKPTERSHRWPSFLPDGRNIVFTIQLAGRQFDDALIATVPISGGEPRVIVEGGSDAKFVESGHLIYGRAGNLLAAEFDPVAVRGGAAITVLDNVRSNVLNGIVPVAVSSAGLLVYLPGQGGTASMALLTANRSGQTQPLLDRRFFNSLFRISPDGTRVAVSMNDAVGQVDIFFVELDSRGLRRFTLDAGAQAYPVWSPDGSRLYYMTRAGGPDRVVARAIDGDGSEEGLSTSPLLPMTISPDGVVVAGRAISTTSLDVMGVDVRTKKTVTIAATAANETAPSFSPDGRYVAYQSDELGRTEVYVKEFPTGNSWQVTTNGGGEPRWTSGGREIVYRNGATLYAVPVTLQPFTHKAPQTLFSVPNMFAFDVSADGRRFVVAQDSDDPEAANFVLITGWFEELKAKMRLTR
jgi:serine/threonine-protein kinase